MRADLSKPFPADAKGFTLVELLTVIVIIGILAGILLPVVSKLRDKSRVTGCLSNLRQVGMAMTSFSFDNNGVFPPCYTTDLISVGWSTAIVDRGYVSDTRILLCPGDTINARPADPGTARQLGLSYTYCAPVMTSNSYDPTVSLNRLKVDSPSRQFMITEWHARPTRWTGEGGQLIAGWDLISSPSLGAKSVSPSHRDGGRNFLFVDGHAEWRTLEKSASPLSGWVMNQFEK
jgi:prepilin-type N-terminal cleavage/methylation domain-containing protein/prepilin-type processing-associated H-X9-DG protein